MKLLYFAWVRTRTGIAEEEVSPPAGVNTVSALIGWLCARGPGYAAAFADLKAVRVAVNQEHAGFDVAQEVRCPACNAKLGLVGQFLSDPPSPKIRARR